MISAENDYNFNQINNLFCSVENTSKKDPDSRVSPLSVHFPLSRFVAKNGLKIEYAKNA